MGAAVEAGARDVEEAVSRRFVARTKRALEQLMARDLSELGVAVLTVDGVHFAEHCGVVALAIGADCTKVPVGLWLGDTENNTVVTHLLADLVDRGLSADGGLLVVIDGAKALGRRGAPVFGEHAMVQRCTLHKRRNVETICPSPSAAGLISAWHGRSTTPIQQPGCDRPRTSPASSRPAGPTPPQACAKAGDMFTVRRLELGTAWPER